MTTKHTHPDAVAAWETTADGPPTVAITLEVVTYEAHHVPLSPGSGRSVGAAIDDILSDAQRRKLLPRSVTVDLPPAFWDTSEVG